MQYKGDVSAILVAAEFFSLPHTFALSILFYVDVPFFLIKFVGSFESDFIAMLVGMSRLQKKL